MSLPPNSVSLPISNGGVITASNYWGNISGSSTTIAPPLGKEYDIQGQMFITDYVVDDVYLEDHVVNPDDIKKRLVEQLVQELYNSKLVEFTSQNDYVNGKKVFRARIFAVPDTMVRILRENGK